MLKPSQRGRKWEKGYLHVGRWVLLGGGSGVGNCAKPPQWRNLKKGHKKKVPEGRGIVEFTRWGGAGSDGRSHSVGGTVRKFRQWWEKKDPSQKLYQASARGREPIGKD